MAPPSLTGAVMCRRALLDEASGMHTLVDVLLEVVVPSLPATTTFDLYLQLGRLDGESTVLVEVSEVGGTSDGAVIGAGTLTLGPTPAAAAAPAPPSIGVALPGFGVTFSRAGEHRLGVRTHDAVLGEHRFFVIDGRDR